MPFFDSYCRIEELAGLMSINLQRFLTPLRKRSDVIEYTFPMKFHRETTARTCNVISLPLHSTVKDHYDHRSPMAAFQRPPDTDGRV